MDKSASDGEHRPPNRPIQGHQEVQPRNRLTSTSLKHITVIVEPEDNNNNQQLMKQESGDCCRVVSTSDLSTAGTTDDEGSISFRGWCDGCYDFSHFGHGNSFRQAALRCGKDGQLFVGVHSDEEIERHKGAPPVFTMAERMIMIRAMRWVYDVIPDASYITTVETLNQYGCNYSFHGNDTTTTAGGVDTYHEVKLAGRYLEVERTQGISTSEIIKRILNSTGPDGRVQTHRSFLLFSLHLLWKHFGNFGKAITFRKCTANNNTNDNGLDDPWEHTRFLCTTQKLHQFADANPSGQLIPPDAKVVYVAGCFDIPHPGHVQFLEAASNLGTHLIVGIYDDATVSRLDGLGRPIMDVNQRAQSILAFRCVSDVVIGAPYLVTEELMDHFNVSVVAHGETDVPLCPLTGQDPYLKAKARGIYQVLNSGSTLTTNDIIKRVTDNRKLYEKRNKNKEKKEKAEAAVKASSSSGGTPGPSTSGTSSGGRGGQQ